MDSNAQIVRSTELVMHALQCSVCGYQFNIITRKPMVVPCGSTFCESCINSGLHIKASKCVECGEEIKDQTMNGRIAVPNRLLMQNIQKSSAEHPNIQRVRQMLASYKKLIIAIIVFMVLIVIGIVVIMAIVGTKQANIRLLYEQVYEIDNCFCSDLQIQLQKFATELADLKDDLAKCQIPSK